MVRQRAPSTASTNVSSNDTREQELGSMYDYLAKIILLGPSGCGKSCLLHRFVKNEWRILSSQTIGVEFASKIVKVGTGARRKRIKLQLWDTAGTERFRSVSRSYYRGAAGAILVYDISSHASLAALPTFLHDARTLASPHLTVLLAGNKADLADPDSNTSNQPSYDPEPSLLDEPLPTPSSYATSHSRSTAFASSGRASVRSNASLGLGTRSTATIAPEGRDVSPEDASRWASVSNIPVAVEVSALSGENVDELFGRLARMILAKIELGEIDPDDAGSGIQYGDSGGWWDDGGSVRSRRGGGGAGKGHGGGDWEDVFRIGRRRGGCC
ncbi:ras-domain-containing protein [Saccharata proteae CBS 121410]|uniref:Ras-domain-containing protein n=1 Tax=Saccharata proteae CBS 121410 TaxID=1314787 RepID=A0A9P4I3L5_9PEZI|nr:ras-domain-containing protein [Saccharata proteae CBS 121410]